MSTELSVLSIAGGYLFAGFGVLALARLTPARRSVRATADMLKLAGLAYVAGLASTSLALIALLCLGAALTPLLFAAVCVSIGTAGFVGANWRQSDRRTPPVTPRLTTLRSWTVEHGFAALSMAAVAAFAVVGYRWAKVLPLANSWDGWSIWIRKGELLYSFGHIPTGFFTSSAYSFMHADYPLLIPVLNALWFHLAGFNTVTLHAEYWVLFVAVLWALAYTASRVTRPALWAPMIGLVAVIPEIRVQLMTLYADIPMALLLMLGVLWLGIWMKQQHRGANLGLATLFLAAAANTKNEGLTAALAALTILWALTLAGLGPKRPLMRHLGLATAGFVLAVAPWRLWTAAHHLSGDVPLIKGLNPVYVYGRLDRLGPALSAVSHSALSSHWYYVLPAALAVLTVGLLTRGARQVAIFYGLTGIGITLSMLWVYVISTNPLPWYLSTSAGRTVDSLVFVGIAALLQVCGHLLPSQAQTQAPGTKFERPPFSAFGRELASARARAAACAGAVLCAALIVAGVEVVRSRLVAENQQAAPPPGYTAMSPGEAARRAAPRNLYWLGARPLKGQYLRTSSKVSTAGSNRLSFFDYASSATSVSDVGVFTVTGATKPSVLTKLKRCAAPRPRGCANVTVVRTRLGRGLLTSLRPPTGSSYSERWELLVPAGTEAVYVITTAPVAATAVIARLQAVAAP